MLIKSISCFGAKLFNDGYGGFIEIGRGKSITKSLLFQLEISERKHPKEEKQNNPFAPTAPIIYGKQNFFYPVKLGVQQQFLLGNKSNKNGVSVTANIGGGISLGLLRPYQLEVEKDGERKFVQYDSPDSSLFLNGPFLGPSFSTGWKELTVTPGIYIKPAFRFDYGRYNEMVSAVEIGLTGEFYTKKMPQVIFSKQQQFFFSAYVAILFGRRK
ncbi:MAG: hypothetical protein IPJ81_19130 [Chitinophagaceae bacterium]|nr:hypothetical protein [Chitinophagaceae bacterium]